MLLAIERTSPRGHGAPPRSCRALPLAEGFYWLGVFHTLGHDAQRAEARFLEAREIQRRALGNNAPNLDKEVRRWDSLEPYDMSWEMLSAIGTFGQFIVVIAAAAFATMQIRQLRRQNELQATIPYFNYARSEVYRSAARLIHMQRSDPPDEQLAIALAAADVSDPRVQQLSAHGDFFNELGLLVQEGLIDGRVVLTHFYFHIGAAWAVLRPFAAKCRRTQKSHMWGSFEALAVRARTVTPSDRVKRLRRQLPAALRADYERSLELTNALPAGPCGLRAANQSDPDSVATPL